MKKDSKDKKKEDEEKAAQEIFEKTKMFSM